MPVGGDGWMSAPELLTVRDELFRAVKASGRLAPLQSSQTDRALAQRRFNAAAFDKPEVAAAEAGRLLGVDYVIYSQMYYHDGRWLLDTGLLDVAGKRVVRFMRGRYTGTEHQVSRQGARINIEQLLDVQEPLPAAPSPAPAVAAPAVQEPPPPPQQRPAPFVQAPPPRREFFQPQEPADPHAKRLDVGMRLQRSATPVFISWMLLPWLGVEFNYNHKLQIDVNEDNAKIGRLNAQQIGTSLFLRYSDEIIAGRRSIPLRIQAGAGAAVLVDTELKGNGWWRNGFEADNRSAYRDWVAAGSPDWPNEGLQRSATPSDSLALSLDLCTSIGITQSLFFDVYLQYLYSKMDTDFDSTWRGSRESTFDGSITINDLSGGIGLRYSF